MFRIFNTLTRKNEIFKPIKKSKVGMYSCGPTVYDFAHIGNLRAYIFADLLRRYLAFSGFRVWQVMNITDVDDKTIKNSQKKGQTLKKFTEFYEKEFIKDMEALNVEMPNVLPKATEHIPAMVALVQKLLKNGSAYESGGSIYFDISKFEKYGKLAQLEKRTLKENADRRLNLSDEYKKEEVNDFVLWKARQKEDGNVFWETEIGKGRPGWHIECSAMSMKYLGERLDIHTGGADLVFPHHTNEIAQSEAATGKKFVNYWAHNEHLLVNGKKMSKSLGNFYTLRDIQEKGYNPLLLRLILLKTHYRKILDFSFDDFKEAKSVAEKFLDFLINLSFAGGRGENNLDITGEISRSRKNFKKAMDDDLNISLALAFIFDFMGEINKAMSQITAKQAQAIKKYIFEIDSVFGFIKPLYKQYQERLKKDVGDKAVKEMIKKRAEARRNNNYAEADKIRNNLLNRGVVVEDAERGYKIRLAEVVE